MSGVSDDVLYGTTREANGFECFSAVITRGISERKGHRVVLK